MSRTSADDFGDLSADEFPNFSLASGEEEGDYSQAQEEPFRLRTEDFISRPIFSENCDIEENVLEFDFSYGYDCKKPYNLVAMDERTIIFASGNLIHFFDVESRDVWFRRSAMGCGIGHIAKNPNSAYPHVAVGENGNRPPIIIYEWPSLEIVCVLKHGTLKTYAHLNYSPNGELLLSQGGEPDYLITIWNWPKSTILLRSKSNVNDVLRVMFSPEVPGQLTSCGVAHIKFWKMASTFTGLKLKGELGRFGKTEYSDIVGIYPMPDEKVISGCYWGNILVWDEGLIKLEVCRKGRKRCHDGPIVQFDYKNGELWTVSMDGRVRLWYYDTIDQADPPDEDRFVQMEPTYDFYTPGAEFMCIEKQYPDPEDTFYFAQDARGGIWRIDLTTETDATPSERLLKSHAGIATSLAVCPWGPFFNTLGIGGRLHLYNYIDRVLLVIYVFPAKGLCLLWVPMHIEPSGEVIISACDDGVIRVGVWKIDLTQQKNSKLSIIQMTKPHVGRINVITMNNEGSIFITGGADSTLFVYQVITEKGKYLRLVPIGYIPTPAEVTCLTWHNKSESVIIVGCSHGQIMIVEVPRLPVPYTTITYLLKVEPIYQKFYSYKSQILRDILLKEMEEKKVAKRALKEIELEKLKRDNPGLEVDEEIYLADSESEEKLDPLYIPSVPNKILWIQHTHDNTLWLSMDGYDAGYIYEYKIGQQEEIPYRFTPIHGAENTVINNFCYSANHDYIILAMEQGSIRVNKVNPRDWRDLSNYWELSMHANNNGFIPGLSFSYDESYFITCGHDGNVFTFRFYPESTTSEEETGYEKEVPTHLEAIEERDCYGVLSLEQTIVKAEQDRINKVANDNKNAYLAVLQNLRETYEEILERNSRLPASQKIQPADLVIDVRVSVHLEEKLGADLALVKRKLAFDLEKSKIRMTKLKRHFIDKMDVFPVVVRAVCEDLYTSSFRQQALDENFAEILSEVDLKIAEAEIRGRHRERPQVKAQRVPPLRKVEHKLEFFLLGLPPEVIAHKLGPQITRLLTRYRKRKEIRDSRAREWEIFNALKPNDITSDFEDENMLKEAENTIGDFKLKSAKNYKVPRHLRESTSKKYKELLYVRLKQYNMVHDFNRIQLEMRDKKKALHEFLIRETKLLASIHEEILPEERKFGPKIFEFGGPADYPEEMYVVKVSMPEDEDVAKKEDALIPMLNLDTLQREVLEKMVDIEPEEHEVETAWETEMICDRYRKKLSDQVECIKRMEVAIKNFDDEITYIREKRITTAVHYNLILLHLLTLNQELMILKDCEAKEDTLSDIVHNRTMNLMDMQDMTANMNNSIEICKKQIEKLQDKEKDIQRQFTNAVSDNKFFDFLRRIFKKKYKPPKVKTDDDSESDSSSSSSDESEDEDAGSIDSKDFGIIRLDENVCPKGCEQTIYDFTFQLRNQRHGIELSIKEHNVQLETMKKELESYMKKMRVAQANLNTSMEELETFQREKQHKLNEIFCTVILRMDQFQHLKEDGTMNTVRDSLVFTKATLSSLYKRVGELSAETIQQLSKHRLSVNHLTRMKTDLNHMVKDIAKLKTQIKEEMRIRFGGTVKVHELDEFMLKKLVFNLRLTLLDVRHLYIDEIRHWHAMHIEKQKQIFRAFHANSSHLELLGILNMELIELEKKCLKQASVQENYEDVVDQADKLRMEIKKLEAIVQKQNKEIETLRNEIKIFKTKGFTPKHHVEITEAPEEEGEEEVESRVSEWEYIDDYMYTESYAREYWATKAIREASKMKQETIASILDELFRNISIELERHMVVNLLKSVISDVMNKCDIEEIITNILANIPGDVSDEQRSLIELTAEKLCSIQDIEEIQAELHSKEILIDIVEEIITRNIEDPEELVSELLIVLLKNLPLHLILEEENLNCVAERLKLSRVDFNQPDLVDKLTEKVQLKTLEARAVLSEILDRVCNFGDATQEATPTESL